MKPMNVLSLLTLGVIASTQVHAQHNTLTPGEVAANYILLFNGQAGALTGWRSWNNTTPPSSWSSLPESTWRVLQNSPSPVSSLITTDNTFQNFDLKLEWNSRTEGNSGIFIRYDGFPGGPLGANGNSWGGCCGPEAQIAATNNSDGSAALHRAGVCYDMFPLLSGALGWDTPGGGTNYNRYQQFRIIAFNNRVAHFGNGVKLLEYVIRSSSWNTAYAASKYNVEPHYGNVHPGSIYLQHHGEENMKFRDIRIKRLTQSPWALGSAYLVNPNDTSSGLRNLTFTDNLFPPVYVFTPLRSNSGVRLFSDVGGLLIRFPNRADYSIQIQDTRGRTKRLIVTDANSYQVPAGSIQNGNVLSVWSGTRKIHQGIVGVQ